jgi:hypothetical protein
LLLFEFGIADFLIAILIIKIGFLKARLRAFKKPILGFSALPMLKIPKSVSLNKKLPLYLLSAIL